MHRGFSWEVDFTSLRFPFLKKDLRGSCFGTGNTVRVFSFAFKAVLIRDLMSLTVLILLA